MPVPVTVVSLDAYKTQPRTKHDRQLSAVAQRSVVVNWSLGDRVPVEDCHVTADSSTHKRRKTPVGVNRCQQRVTFVHLNVFINDKRNFRSIKTIF